MLWKTFKSKNISWYLSICSIVSLSIRGWTFNWGKVKIFGPIDMITKTFVDIWRRKWNKIYVCHVVLTIKNWHVSTLTLAKQNIIMQNVTHNILRVWSIANIYRSIFSMLKFDPSPPPHSGLTLTPEIMIWKKIEFTLSKDASTQVSASLP